VTLDPDATLAELEPPGWADPDFPSPLVARIRALAHVPLRELTTDDLQLLLRQRRALGTVVPLALARLAADPFVEDDGFPGALLLAVAHVAGREPTVRARLAAALARLDELEDDDRAELEPALRAAYEAS
jgi:hypothetical protein